MKNSNQVEFRRAYVKLQIVLFLGSLWAFQVICNLKMGSL